MGLFSKADAAAKVVDSASGLAEKIGEAFDKTFTSEEERMAMRNDLVTETGKLVTELNKMRQEIIIAEATGTPLQRNWRPITMLVFVGIIVCIWVLFPIINLFAKSVDLAVLISSLQESTRFWDVIELGLGGYVIGRSVEKVADSVGKNMNITIGKKK